MTSIQLGSQIDTQDRARPPHAPASTNGSDPLRRVLNVSVTSVLLILATPVMLVIAALIRLTSKGPVLYAQTRIGIDRRQRSPNGSNFHRKSDLGGKPFTIYKFRTMEVHEDPDVQVWARPDDPRITPLGRILRKYRFDELPQLVNVLRGDMNLVGPRPEQPKIFADLRDRIDEYADRQRVLPGITGWAQVNHRYDVSVEDVKRKLALDLEYLKRCSVSEDLKIMLRTLPVILLRKGGW